MANDGHLTQQKTDEFVNALGKDSDGNISYLELEAKLDAVYRNSSLMPIITPSTTTREHMSATSSCGKSWAQRKTPCRLKTSRTQLPRGRFQRWSKTIKQAETRTVT